MDKLEKSLAKLSKEEMIVATKLIERIVKGDLKNLDTRKLKGYDDAYRVRKGKIRIIFRKNDSQTIILQIARRSETTYRK